MIEKIDRLTDILANHSREDIKNQYVLSDAIQFEFEKLYEDITRLSFEIKFMLKTEMDSLRGIRNRVAHDYETVIINVLLDTIENDLPAFKETLITLLSTMR